MPSFIDITGNKYGRLKVERRADNVAYGVPAWHCICDCGKDCIVRGYYLKNGKTKSCGCLRSEVASANRKKHGRSDRGDGGYYVYSRELHIKRKYKLTMETYNAVLEGQGHRCSICGYQFGQQRGDAYVDHCHSSGSVRAVLCRTCNSGIGQFKDKPELLREAANYLERHQ